MRRIYIDGSATACFNIRCCALCTILHMGILSLRGRIVLEGTALERMFSLSRDAWMALVEALELSAEEQVLEQLFYGRAQEAVSELLGMLESVLVEAGQLPWSCQSIEYMRLASATYMPLGLEGELFAAYWEYYRGLHGKLSDFLNSDDDCVCINSLIVLARYTLQALERRVSEPVLAFHYEGDAVASDLKVAGAVPQCPYCGHLMKKDENLQWVCPVC